jgi:hypothetical protein
MDEQGKNVNACVLSISTYYLAHPLISSPLDDLRVQISKIRDVEDIVFILVNSSQYLNNLMKVLSFPVCHPLLKLISFNIAGVICPGVP